MVRPETAKEFNLKTLSDLGKASSKLRLGAGTEFVDRRDGIAGLKEVYGAQFAEFKQFAALRLRYEVTRQFAPYVGVSFERKFGRTADYASAAGQGRSQAAVLAGVSFWF